MSTTPTGSPAWVRANGPETYGGRADKRNYASQGAVNGQTDVDVSEFLRLTADLAALQRVAPFATIVLKCNDTSPAAPTILAHAGMVDPPAVARVTDGTVELTWLPEYADAYGVAGQVHIGAVVATVLDTATRVAVYELDDPDSNGLNERVTVRVMNASNVVVADATVSITVWTVPA
jgi:hypothetical protein